MNQQRYICEVVIVTLKHRWQIITE